MLRSHQATQFIASHFRDSDEVPALTATVPVEAGIICGTSSG
jgi:hypothetical protein